MDKEEIHRQMKMSLEELGAYHQQKYGIPAGNYYLDEACTKVNKNIRRTIDGLELHHLPEALIVDDKVVMNLSKRSCAIEFPFEYQDASNLCYCNLLEHFLHHVKINIRRMQHMHCLVQDGCTIMIQRLDDLYEDCNPNNKDWNMFQPIKDNYKEYIEISNMLADAAEELGLI